VVPSPASLFSLVGLPKILPKRLVFASAQQALLASIVSLVRRFERKGILSMLGICIWACMVKKFLSAKEL